MKFIEPGEELRFQLLGESALDMDDPAVRRAITTLANRGLRIAAEDGQQAPGRKVINNMHPGLESLEALHPVRYPTDFMGKEHFRVYGDMIRITHRLSGTLFRTLVCPNGRYKHRVPRAERIDHTLLEDVDVRFRDNVGLGPLPKNVQSTERGRGPLETRAIAVSSVIFIGQNPRLIETQEDVGIELLAAVADMASFLVDRTTNGYQADLFGAQS